MTELEENQAEEIERLRTKCNLQLDHIKQQEFRLKELNTSEKNTFVELYQLFFNVCASLLEDDKFYQSKKDTEISRKFRIIEARVLKEYIARFNAEKVKDIMSAWADLELLGRIGANQLVFNFTINGHSVRCVRVSKIAVVYVSKAMLQKEPVEVQNQS